MTAGFLQTFSFMQDEENMFKPVNLLKYYAWRVFKFIPLLATILAFGMFLVPLMGTGPIWYNYSQAMGPCNS